MKTALHIQTHVLPGNRIEITNPRLHEGDAVELILLLPPVPAEEHYSALDVITALQGHRLFQSPEEVDRHLREERDAWER